MRTLLTADWTNLAVVTFETDKKLLAKYIPYKTELNDWNGSYYLSLVGFQFSHPSINGIPMPFYRSFEELNLRFYIRYKSGNEWQKGVVFIKEVAPSPVIGMVARFLYRESFISLPMKHSIENTDTKKHIHYYWKMKRSWNYLKLTTGLLATEPPASSLESFIRDNYRACTTCSKEKTKEFEIEHPHWNIYPGLSFEMELDAENIYGKEFSSCFRQKPRSCFLMDGSRTKVSYPSLL
jgi:uncharacterized protein YqjF (DUF2071 family)